LAHPPPEALFDWMAQLHQRFAGGKIAIILEQSRGSLLYALLPHAHLVLFPINPQMTPKFRKAFYYQLQLQRGKGRHAAFRSLAFNWQRIMWRFWQDRTPLGRREIPRQSKTG